MKREETLRREWADMQARWNAAHERYVDFLVKLQVKYPWSDVAYLVYRTNTEACKLESLDRVQDRLMDRIYAWLDLHFSGHGLRSSTPLAHVCGRMTFNEIPRGARLADFPASPMASSG